MLAGTEVGEEGRISVVVGSIEVLLEVCSIVGVAEGSKLLDEGTGCTSSTKLVVDPGTEVDTDSNAEVTSVDDTRSEVVDVCVIKENTVLSGMAASEAALDADSATLKLEVWPSVTGVAVKEGDIVICALGVVTGIAGLDVDMLFCSNGELVSVLENCSLDVAAVALG